MKPVALVPHAALERKPKHGAPCNSCGMCCMATRCIVGRHLFGTERGPCPALMKISPHEYTCGALHMTSPGSERAAVALLIRAGEGCDARFNGEWTNAAFHKQQDETDAKNADAIAAAMELLHIQEAQP